MSRAGDFIDRVRESYFGLNEGFRFFVAIFAFMVLLASLVAALS